ncbi:MAG: peptide MFS transporter [Flavobacteriales bacterium]|nr:peptide MFS transporter [Flavobacteriales bacterium]
MSSTAAAPANTKHPKGLYLLFFTEMWERFGFYLMLGILFLYMTDSLKGGLGFGEGEANDWYGTYIALVYLTPFIGGLLADRIFGYRKTIVAGGLLMASGYLTLAIPGTTAFFVAIALIIVGNGLFKPNISTLLGNLYNKPEYSRLKDKGYNIFYMGINIGAFVCNFVAAWLRNEYGWGYAFAAAGIGMLIGVGIFISGSKDLAEADQIKPAQKEDMSMGRITATIFLPALVFAGIGFFAGRILGVDNIFGSASNDTFLFACIPVLWFYLNTYLKSSPQDKKPLGSLLYIYVVVIVFWAIFHQNGNVLTGWAERNTWRPIPESMVGFAGATGMLQEVDDVPGEVNMKITKQGETMDTTYAVKFEGLYRSQADNISTLLAGTVEKSDPKAADTSAVFTAMRPVATRAEGKVLAESALSAGMVKKLTYNKYLDVLPRSEWPTEKEPAKLISTELFQSLNPFFVVLLTPLVIGIFTFLGSRGKEPSTPAKIAFGLLITGLSTLVMIAAVSASGNAEHKVSAMWLVGTYAVITFGELCLSPMGLSLVSKLSPARLTAVMMGGWFLSTSIGNKLAGVLGHMGSDSANKSLVFYINCAGAMLCAFLLFIAVKRIAGVLKEKTGHY